MPKIDDILGSNDIYVMLNLRKRRNDECFAYINRGELWYNTLTEEQKNELNTWYSEWLDVTETKVVPIKPSWLT